MKKSEEYQYRRSVLRVLLIVTIFAASFFAVFNWTVGLKTYAAIEAIVAAFWCYILSILNTTRHLQRWSFVYLCTFYSLVLLGIVISSLKSGLFSWILIFPILSYLLLGRRIGTAITCVGIFSGLGIIGWRVWQQTPEVHWIILANVGLCAVAIWAMSYVYESKRETVVNHLQEMATRDPLTSLLNMRTMHATLTYILRRAKRRSESVAVAYIDINDFKVINDTQGHQRGNEILLAVASAINAITRPEDHAFRHGGDEFFIIFANCTQAQAQNIYGQRLAAELSSTVKDLSLSIGYAQTGINEYISPDALIQQADQNMYAVKYASKLKPQSVAIA